MELNDNQHRWIKRCVDDYFKTTNRKPKTSYSTELYLNESDGTFRYHIDFKEASLTDIERYFGEWEYDPMKSIIYLYFDNIEDTWEVQI